MCVRKHQKNDNKVSVILPIYNVAPYLKKCIDSILAQTYSNLEVILVDDGSKDESGAICDAYIELDCRISVIHKSNGGLSSARNAGLDAAKGDYIAFIDSDDWIEPDMVEKLISAILREDADLAVCGVRCEDEYGDDVAFDSDPITDGVLIGKHIFEKAFLFQAVWLITACNRLYKSSLLQAYRFPEGRLHEDVFAAHYIYDKCRKVVTISDPLYVYLQRTGSITTQKSLRNYMDIYEAMYDKYLFFKEKGKGYEKFAQIAAREMGWGLRRAFSAVGYEENIELFKPLYTRTLFLLLRYGDLRAAKLFLYRHKKFIKSIINTLKIPLFALNFAFQVARTARKRRIFLVATPEHGNLGDHAIVYAEKNFLTKFFPNMPLIEIGNSEYLNYADYIARHIRPGDIIAIDGGGNLGTLWGNEDDKISDIISRFSHHKIIVFPQTCYYDDTDSGRERIARNKEIYVGAKNLLIALRDKASYDFMKINFPCVKTVFIPDIVFSIMNAPKNVSGSGILLCMRKDKEKVLRPDIHVALKEIIKSSGMPSSVTDTLVDRRVTAKNRELELTQKWREFAEAGIVITDRLHGMIFAAITGTPCIAFDNKSGKVKGGYEFIKHLPYIRYVDDAKEISNALNELYGKPGSYRFDYPLDKAEDFFVK